MQLIKKEQKSVYKLLLIIVMLISFILLLSPPPYFVIKPGEVNSTYTFIQDNSEDHMLEREGEKFYFTTVLLSEASWYEIAKASFQPHQALVSKKELLGGKALNDYIARSELTMKQSQKTAMEAAYVYLGIPYKKEAKELYVSTLSKNKSSQFLEADRIKAMVYDNVTIIITNMNQLLDEVNRWSGTGAEPYSLIVETKGQERLIQVKHPSTARFPLTEEELASDYMLSAFIELNDVIAEDESKWIAIENKQVGGPSAGLILALTFIDTLKEEAMMSSYDIAATGTINPDGQIGIIGSIKQKVVAVEEAGVELFLVPKEQQSEAQKKAKSINSAVTIVGVSTLAEAVEVINRFKLE